MADVPVTLPQALVVALCTMAIGWAGNRILSFDGADMKARITALEIAARDCQPRPGNE